MSILPELPKQHKKKEADFGVRLKKWFEDNALTRITSAIEIKQTETDSIPFSCVSDKQTAFALRIQSDKGVWIRVQGTNGEPDYIWLKEELSLITIKFPKSFHLIPINNFLHEKETSKRKSLTEKRASEIAIKSVVHR